MSMKENTTWPWAAEGGSLKAIEALWSWVTEVQLNVEDMQNKLFLCQNEEENTALYLAAPENNEELLKKLCISGKEVKLNWNKLKNKL